MDYSTIISSNKLLAQAADGVVQIVLNRPEKRNALSREMIGYLDTALSHIADDAHVRVVVLAAQGPAFCAGHDLNEMVGCGEPEYREMFANCSRMMMRLRQLPQPVIARVHGTATAAGCQLVAACDLAVAAEQAMFATPGVKIGLFCTTPMVPLVRTIPPKAALEMLLTGQPISAQRALELGLVNRVVPAEKLDTAVAELAEAIKSYSSEVIRIGKAAFYDQLTMGETRAYERAVQVMVHNAGLPAAREGIQAFLDGRPPIWPDPV